MPPVKKTKPANASKKTGEVSQQTVVSGQLDKRIKNKIKKLHEKQVNPRGVVFIKHLPHGFFEEQLSQYFEQFGNVTRLRLARSKRSGGSKCFAFVEFEYPEVAQVAAETMDNYLMFRKVVKASYIPPEKQCFNYFKTSVRKVKNKAGKEIYVSSKTAAAQRSVKKHNNWSDDAFQTRTMSQLRKANKLKKKYAYLGIDFSKILVAPKKLTAEEKKQRSAANNKAESVASSSKRKAPTDTKNTAIKENQKVKKMKKVVGLEDLLGNTIIDDSEDEDYIAMASSDESADDSANDAEEEFLTSDEETYGFSKDEDETETDNDDDDEDDEDDDEDENENENEVDNKTTSKASFNKSLKPRLNRIDELIKRKPLMGGIQKLNKKPIKKSTNSKTKTSMQLKSAKELAKPLSSLKGKGAVKATAGGRKVKL